MRTALVTGASRGIGYGIARDLARQGFGLTITARSKQGLDGLAETLAMQGSPRVLPHAVDLADRVALTGLVRAHSSAFESMDVLVLCGGVGTAGTLESLEPERIDKMMAVNVNSAIAILQHSLPLLRAAASKSSHGSRVILLSSISGVYAEAGLAVYGASKAALMSLAASVNAEESRNGVMVTAIAPAFVDTDMSSWAKNRIPAESMIPVDDVVATIRGLLSLTRRTSITELILSRSGASPYSA